MRSYGQTMTILPANPGELVGGDRYRKTFPTPDEFGGNIESSKYNSTMDWLFTESEVKDWSTDEWAKADIDLVEWDKVIAISDTETDDAQPL